MLNLQNIAYRLHNPSPWLCRKVLCDGLEDWMLVMNRSNKHLHAQITSDSDWIGLERAEEYLACDGIVEIELAPEEVKWICRK